MNEVKNCHKRKETVKNKRSMGYGKYGEMDLQETEQCKRKRSTIKPESNNCECGMEELEDVEHLWYRCRKERRIRGRVKLMRKDLTEVNWNDIIERKGENYIPHPQQSI